jgi:hypothetical protein
MSGCVLCAGVSIKGRIRRISWRSPTVIRLSGIACGRLDQALARGRSTASVGITPASRQR